MISRKENLEKLFESFQMIKRNLMVCPKEMHQAHRITPSQWGAIRIIAQQKETTVKEVAKILATSSSAITQLIDGLVKEGYVIRKESKKDRRSILLTLSAEAKKKMIAMKKHALQQLDRIFKVLNDEELNLYLEFNRKIAENIIPK